MNVLDVLFDSERYCVLEWDTTTTWNDVATFEVPEDSRTVGENLQNQLAGGRVL